MSHRFAAGAVVRGSLLCAFAFVALAVFAVITAERANGASSAAPQVREGQTICTDIKPQRKELAVVPPVIGTHTFDDGTLSGSYTLDAANHLDWTSNELPVDYVLVYGQGATNYYQYAGGTTSDTGLAAPGDAAIAAVRFCYDNQNRGRVKIVKETDPAGSTERFAFHPSADLSLTDFTLADGESIDLRPKPGTYTVQEADMPGWKVDKISCDDMDSGGSGSTLTLMVDPDETIVCTFRNVKEEPPAVVPPAVVRKPTPRVSPPPAPVAAPRAPQSAVEAAVARSGRARLVRPTRCVARRFNITVSGSPVRQIQFTVNGRRVKVVAARTGQRTFTVTLPAAGGTVQRVAARVAFANGARSRTLRTTVLRCAPRQAVAPQFTG
jgi:hypothetical protein